MKIFVVIEGDKSVGIYEEEVIIDWPSVTELTLSTDPEWCEQFIEAVEKLFTLFCDFPAHARFEVECPDCGSTDKNHKCLGEEPKEDENLPAGVPGQEEREAPQSGLL